MLDPNKAHDHDMIRIRMIKICGNAICKPLQLIFRSCIIENGELLSEQKKANVVPFHKKGNKQTLENYCPVSLLPICGKVFERLSYNSLFEFFIENELISSTNLVLNQVALVEISSFPLLMKSINPLMMYMKPEVFSLINQKHLIKFGTTDSFLN